MKHNCRLVKTALSLLTAAALLTGCGGEKPEDHTRPPETLPAATAAPTQAPTEAPAVQWPKLKPGQLQNEVFIGDWLHSEEPTGFWFDGAGNFWFYDNGPEGGETEGVYQYDGETLYLKDPNEMVFTGYMDSMGSLVLDGMPGYFVYTEPEPTLDQSLVGEWTYNLGALTYIFDEEGNFTSSSDFEAYEAWYDFDGMNLTIFDGKDTIDTGWLSEDGRLYLESLNGWFYTEGGISYEPLDDSDAEELVPNCQTGKMRTPLDGSVAVYRENGGDYHTVTGEWMAMQSDVQSTGDGFVEFTVVAACYVPYSNMPYTTGTIGIGCLTGLYDRYTGLALRQSSYSKVGDNGYEFLFDSADGRVELGYTTSQSFSGPVGDCIQIITVEYNIRMPEWYDGLILVGSLVPDNVEDYAETGKDPVRPLGLNTVDNGDGTIGYSLRYAIG